MGEAIASGSLQFFLENRIVVDDGGPSLQVLAEVEQQMVQLLRFDMFYKQPHYHYDPNGQNIRYNLDPLALEDGIGWVMSLLRSKLPQLVAKAGQDGLLSSEGNAAVVASLPLIEARWRAQEPANAMNASS